MQATWTGSPPGCPRSGRQRALRGVEFGSELEMSIEFNRKEAPAGPLGEVGAEDRQWGEESPGRRALGLGVGTGASSTGD